MKNFRTEVNVNAFDEDGDTSLHLALNDKLSPSELLSPTQLFNTNNKTSGSNELKECRILYSYSQSMPSEFCNIRIIIASYLIQSGANLYAKNKHQISPLDCVSDSKISDYLQKQFASLQSDFLNMYF